MTLTSGRQKRGVSRERLQDCSDEIARKTAGMEGGSLRVDWRKLDDDEQVQLVKLTDNIADLREDDMRQWHRLVEKGSGQPGLFGRLAQEAETLRGIARLAQIVARRPIQKDEESGLFTMMALQLDEGHLNAEGIAVLCLTMVALHTGKGLGPHSRVEATPSGTRLVYDNRFGLLGGKLDPEGRFANVNTVVKSLAGNEWFVVDQLGGETAIRLGRRATLAMSAAARLRAKRKAA